MVKPRGWQVRAHEQFVQSKKLAFLAEATPGAGKTMFSAFCARSLLQAGEVDFVVAVVPTRALKGCANSGFMGDWKRAGLELTPQLKDGKGRPKSFQGAVITYQQLPNIASTLETWARNGVRLMFVFDEVHHASESNRWGAAAEQCGRAATKLLAMTGTPFRGDGRRISFVRYSDDDKAIPDAAYSYRKAVTDNICREVFFRKDDGIAEYIHQDETFETRVSDAEREEASRASAVLFNPKVSQWLEKVLYKADETLDDYRLTDVDAGGIVICRPGGDENDERHLRQVAKLLERVTGEEPEVVGHEDKDAAAKISRFRSGKSKWICAVRMISEGVDIKRLRVMVMANRPSTELLFRQMVGRVVRNESNGKLKEHATVFIADFPQLREWAQQVADEAQAGIKDQQDVERNEPIDREKGSGLIPLNATYEENGGISDFGEVFTAAEVDYAESLKRGDTQLAPFSTSAIVHLLRKAKSEIPGREEIEEPLYVRKMERRKKINKLGRNLAIRINPEKPDFAAVWKTVHQRTGVKSLDDLTDNYDLAKMEQVKQVIESLLTGLSNAA